MMVTLMLVMVEVTLILVMVGDGVINGGIGDGCGDGEVIVTLILSNGDGGPHWGCW